MGYSSTTRALLNATSGYRTKYVYADMVSSGITFYQFACPNRDLEFVVTNPRDLPEDALTNPKDHFNTLTFVRTAFYQMAGRDQRAINAVTPRPGTPRRVWLSPTSVSDNGDLPMVACMLEKGTVNPAVSTFPHGPRGLITTKTNAFYPEQTDSLGGNVASNDGSTSFIPTDEAIRFVAHPKAGNIVAHWQDVDSYNKVNP